MEESLEDRLKSHAQAFDGLLSLIPANLYYEDDKSEQWQRKKQTKDQAKAAKLAKLNPDNARSAKDLLDEREAKSNGSAKRKRNHEDEDQSIDSQDDQAFGIDQEKPMEGLKRKKIKADLTTNVTADQGAAEKTKQEIKAIELEAKLERRRLKDDRKKEKLKEKARAKQTKAEAKKEALSKRNPQIDEDDTNVSDDGNDFDALDVEDLEESIPESPPSKPPSPTFDIPNTVSGTSSISSIATQNAATTLKPVKTKPAQGPPAASPEELRARLQSRIAELRNARRADGDADRPARSRTELIEQRKKKTEQKKATKKALRAQVAEEERKKRNEALARGSPLMTPLGNMSPAQVSSPSSESPSFSFSRVAFENGQVMSANLTSLLNPQKKASNGTKISKDTLDNLERREERLSNMTPEQRASAEEKDMWLHAKNRAQGLRVKDDTSLLKKALKRKDNKKKKSTKDWDGRLAGVANAQAAKQKRREENLTKRKEEKGTKSGKGKKSSGKGKKKVKSRPGFEGSFKASGKSKRK